MALVMHRGGVYLAELEEVLDLPADVWGRANPKSSTGRLDIFVRVLTEHGDAFDTIPIGYRGRLFLEITPQSFHVTVRRGDCLSQLRLARGQPVLGADELRTLAAGSPPVHMVRRIAGPGGRPAVAGGAAVDRPAERGRAGGLPRASAPAAGRPARRDLPVDRYWTPIQESADRGVVLEPEQFYIFATRERLRIPPGSAPSSWRSTPRRVSCARTTPGSSTPASGGRTARAPAPEPGWCWRFAPTTCRSCWSTGRRCSGSSSCATRPTRTCCTARATTTSMQGLRLAKQFT
jgi:dCTP deaminase